MGFFSGLSNVLSGAGSSLVGGLIGGVPGLIIGAGSSLITSALADNNSKKATNRQKNAELELMNAQNEQSLKNLTISPTLQMQGLKAAGISPQFMNGVNPAPTGASGSAGSFPIQTEPVGAAAGSASLTQAELNNARSSITNINERLLLVDEKYRKEINESNVAVARANAREKASQANLNSQQWRLMESTIDDCITQAGLITQSLQADVRMKDIDMKMQYNDYIRDCYMTQNYETFYDLTLEQMRLNLGEAAAKIRNMNSDSNLKYNEAVLVKEQAATEALRRVNLGYQNEVAAAVYKLQIGSLTSRYIMEKKQFDATYIPSVSENRALFEARKVITELEAKAKQFDVDHQDQRLIMEWVRAIGDQVGNVSGAISPFKAPLKQVTKTFKESSSGSWSESTTVKSYVK